MRVVIITDDSNFFVNVDEKKWSSVKCQLMNDYSDFVDFGEIIIRKDLISKVRIEEG